MMILYYIILSLIGVLNGFLSQYLFVFLGSFLFTGVNKILLYIFPIYIFSTSIPALYAVFALLEIIVISLISKIILRRFNSNQRLLTIIIIFVVLQLATLILPPYFRQKQFEHKNPVEANINLDFSKPVLVRETNNGMKLRIEGNKIIWTELTKEYPTYPQNIWSVLLFELDSQTNQGTIIKASADYNVEEYSPVGLALLGKKVYWTRGGKLYSYNPETKEQEEMVTADAANIYGGNGNYIILSHDDKTMYGAGYYIYDLLSHGAVKLPSNLDLQNTDGISRGPVSDVLDITLNYSNMKDGAFCYFSGVYDNGGTIRRYSLISNTDILLGKMPVTAYHIQDCDDKRVLLSTEKTLEAYEVNGRGELGKIFEKTFTSPVDYDGATKAQERLEGQILYYSVDERSIIARDLLTGVEKTIVEVNPGKLGEWVVDKDFVAYFKETGQYKRTLYIKRVK